MCLPNCNLTSWLLVLSQMFNYTSGVCKEKWKVCRWVCCEFRLPNCSSFRIFLNCLKYKITHTVHSTMSSNRILCWYLSLLISLLDKSYIWTNISLKERFRLYGNHYFEICLQIRSWIGIFFTVLDHSTPSIKEREESEEFALIERIVVMASLKTKLILRTEIFH